MENNKPEKFTLVINFGNDAMQHPEDLAQLLSEVVEHIHENGAWPEGPLLDVNGNTVGFTKMV